MKNIEEKLRNYLDGTIPEDEKIEIDRLINEDAFYCKKFEEMLRLLDGLNGSGLPEAPPSLHRGIMNAYRIEIRLNPDHYSKVRNKILFERVVLHLVLIVPLMMMMIYSIVAISRSAIRLDILAIELETNWLIWTLVLLNIFYGARLLWKSRQLKYHKH